jgi:prevent-host-death family protein
MASERISATDAARKFSELLNRVRYRGDQFEVVRGGVVIARIVPAAASKGPTVRSLFAALGNAERPDPGFADDLEAVQADQQTANDPWAT